MRPRISRFALWTLLASTLGMASSSCEGTGTPTGGRADDASAATAVKAPAAPLSGTVTVDGSSTVLPISTALANAFQKVHLGVRVMVRASGTSAGFKEFCVGRVELTGASRPINSAENQECQANRVEYIELPVAFDSVAVVVNARNAFVPCLTVSELKRVWEPAAEGTVTRWNQIRSTFPGQPLALFGPGAASGTFDYFTLAVVGTESRSRSDYSNSEDDETLAKGIAADPNALGYFSYAYYMKHRDTLKLVAVDNGGGCITPSPDTLAARTYEPLSRPLFIYMSTTAAARPEADALARFYLHPENTRQVREIGYVPLATATLLATNRRLANRVTGSIFGGRGSVLGLTEDTLQDEDRIKNALVQ